MVKQTRPRVALDVRLATQLSTGDSTYWRGVIEGLAQQEDLAIEPLLLSDQPAPPWLPSSFKSKWYVIESREIPGRSRWWSWVQFPQSARRQGCDLIHSQYAMSPLCRGRAVTTIHDVSFFIGPEWFPTRDRWLLQRLVPATCRRARGVITVSETSRREIEQYIPAAQGKVKVTLNASGPVVKPLDKREAREQLDAAGFPSRYILALGTRWPRKNLGLAVDAYARYRRENPETKVSLVVAGKSGWSDVRSAEGVFLPGYVPDELLSALYAGADLFLLPSLHEGFGIPILEAFTARCPVLCGPGGAMPEVAGQAAAVAPDYQEATWAKLIADLLADSGKLDSMRDKGVSRLSQFSWGDHGAKLVEAYLGWA